MTTEEKLQHFYDASIESAQKDAQNLKDEHKKSLEKMFLEHKTAREQEINQRILAESRILKREINKTVSAKQLEYRRILSSKTEEFEDAIFEEVEKKLMAFKSTPDYLEFLCRHVEEALKFASDDDLTIYIDPSDKDLLSTLKDRCGRTPLVSKDSWMGGMRAVIRSKNILIDYSFTTLLRDAREKFIFTGGNADA